MRNIFDQYTHPENRLTHSLAVALHEDKALLKSFVESFGPDDCLNMRSLHVIEQGLPGSVEVNDEDEAERRGLPDAVIFNEDEENSWALVIESKIRSSLTRDQLQRHYKTAKKCGIHNIYGLAITVEKPSFSLKKWRMTTWKDIYAWANKENSSAWAKRMVDFFNVAEAKMIEDEYHTKGTITEFAGIDVNPYTYLEGKRVLRLLTNKIKKNKSFMREMNLDPKSKRSSITNQHNSVWDFIAFNGMDFRGNPHCTFDISGKDNLAAAKVTFPNSMNGILKKRLVGSSYDDFSSRLESSLISMKRNLRGVKGYKPVVKIVQRHYKTQRSAPITDGEMTVDLRVCFGGKDNNTGQFIKKQEQWLKAIYELLNNKRSNIQFQIGTNFYTDSCSQLKSPDADQIFMEAFRAMKPFVKSVLAGA